jgi:hypothetical protein
MTIERSVVDLASLLTTMASVSRELPPYTASAASAVVGATSVAATVKPAAAKRCGR